MDVCEAVLVPLCVHPLSDAAREELEDGPRDDGAPVRPELPAALDLLEREYAAVTDLRSRVGGGLGGVNADGCDPSGR